MKIEKSAIVRLLKQLKGFIPTKGDYNQGILLKDNMLTANSFELGITVKLPFETNESFIIPPRAIDMIESLPDGEIDISSNRDGNKITIKTASGKSAFSTTPVDSFAEVKAIGVDCTEFTLDAEAVKTALDKVSYACSTNNVNTALTGILIESKDGYLNFVTTDGSRLAINQIEYSHEISITVPKISLQKAFSIGLKGKLNISATKNNAIIKCGDYTVYTRLIEGDFVNYGRILDAAFGEGSHSVKINRAELLESLTRSQICGESRTVVPVVLHGKDNILNITLKSSLSEFNENVEMSEPFPTEIEIAFNGAFLIEALKSFDENVLELRYVGELKPMALCGKTLKAVVVPVRRS